ncbi:outer membrane protein assembly factor BamE [Roseicyclus persicicus]|uniref:Outer membrane protein assembly factor BamE n=1 Tax=Roseicyclus persicicus TaxID=2650661 RepID=A0A7X6H287_9RHOB|nr:outer membrane protein assembly factor BamE [Roseibacterium persicicum]NKX45833.1 outer membrane protein assembly factor BamE [Roseibacterium persicicum]
MVRTHRAIRRGLVGLALALSLAACSATFDNHGYVPPPEELATVNIGDSREAVAEAIGTPGAAGVMRDEAWFYTAYRVRNYAYQAPQVIERQILAVSFDPAGRVTNIEEFGLQDGNIVQLSRRVTTSSVREVSFLSQILSNFGRINIGNALGGN